MLSRISVIPFVIITVACALLGACCASARNEKSAPPPPDPIARFAGRWAKFGPYNIIGAGSDQVWTIAREDGCWSLAITVVNHPSVNAESRELTRTTYAPTPLAWRDGRLEFVDPRSPEVRQRFTVDVVGDHLMLPAVVQRDERTWEYQSGSDRESFQCAHDPHVVPGGDAVLSLVGVRDRPCFYRTIEDKSGLGKGEMKPAILFFQIDPSGAEHVCARVVFEGEPWGTVVWRGTSFSGFFGESWERLDDENWYRITFLPRVERP